MVWLLVWILGLMLSSTSVLAGEIPTGFQSVKWGATVSDLQAAHPGAKCSASRRTAIGDSSCYVSSMAIAGARGDVLFFFYLEPSDPRALGFGGYSFNFKSDDFNRVRAAFIERYGEPQKTEDEDIKTQGGLSLMNSVLSWDWPGVTARLERYAGRIDRSIIRVRTAASDIEFRRRADEEKKRGAKDF